MPIIFKNQMLCAILHKVINNKGLTFIEFFYHRYLYEDDFIGGIFYCR